MEQNDLPGKDRTTFKVILNKEWFHKEDIIPRKLKINDIFAYLLGNYRYWIYRKPSRWFLMRRHIREQIDWRIQKMDQDCYLEGSCKLCGCETPALQMANKACDKPCYPKMMNRKEWKAYQYFLSNPISKLPVASNIKVWKEDRSFKYVMGIDPYKLEEDGESLGKQEH